MSNIDPPPRNGVRRNALALTLLPRQGQNSLPIRLVDGEGFFGVGMFPDVENLLVHASVDLRHHRVDDDLGVGITQQLVGGAAPVDLQLLGSLLREGDIASRTGHQVEDSEDPALLEILGADGATVDQTDADVIGHGRSPSQSGMRSSSRRPRPYQ